MNCHGDKQNNRNGHKHGPAKHMLHMIICCGLPIIILLSLPLIAEYNLGLAGVLGIIAPFICPVMMGGMMMMMFRSNKKSKIAEQANMQIEKSEE